MDFLQKLSSIIVTFLIKFCPRLSQPISEQEQQPATSIMDIEMSQQPETLTSVSSPSPSNDSESSAASGEASSPLTPRNLNLQPELIHAIQQQHLQWQNAVLAFCFSFALSRSLQPVGTDQSNHEQLTFPLILLSSLVLLAFTFILVAFFIHRSCKRTSQALEKVAFLLAAAAFCHTLSIPLSFELQCAIWAVFFLSLVIVMIFICLKPKAVWC